MRVATAMPMWAVVTAKTPTTCTGSETCHVAFSSGNRRDSHRMAGASSAHEYQYPRLSTNSSDQGAGSRVNVETK
jgi:hypothetical protein